MCGICGIYHYRASGDIDRNLLHRMNSSMTHRGPDDEGLYVDRTFGMAMRRLSIVDIAGGHQPMFSEDGATGVVFNGEIYNFADLRALLGGAGHKFTTRSDTEVLVHGYEEWGYALPSRLNGMFGFAVWNSSEGELMLCRDHFGIKPLYFCDDGETLIFGSEIEPVLLGCGRPPEVDPISLEWFLRYRYVPSPRTMFAGISRLRPGHSLIVSKDQPPVVSRFSSATLEHRAVDASSAVDAFERRMIDTVGRQLVADVPVGLMLSGGVDSGLLGHMMARVSGERPRTFSVGFAEDATGNELAAAAATARSIGSVHHELEISQEEYLDFLPRSIEILEEPVATPSTLALQRLSEFARTEVKVALTGQGADEPLAGYPRYAFERALDATEPLSAVRDAAIRLAARAAPDSEKLYRASFAVSTIGAGCHVDAVNRVLGARELSSLRGPLLLGTESVESPFDYWTADTAGSDRMSALQYVDARTMLGDNLLLYGDKTSMSASLELRVPYLDRTVVEFVEALTPRMKFRSGRGKWLLRQVARRYMDDEALGRKKVNFAVPVGRWLSGPLGDLLVDLVMSSRSCSAEWLNRDAVLEMLRSHRSGARDWTHVLFAILTLELWYRRYIVEWAERHRVVT